MTMLLFISFITSSFIKNMYFTFNPLISLRRLYTFTIDMSRQIFVAVQSQKFHLAQRRKIESCKRYT